MLVRVSLLPGAVLLAAPPDWDARQLHATLRDVAALPVKGFAKLGAAGWRSMEDQRRVTPEEVARIRTLLEEILARIPDYAIDPKGIARVHSVNVRGFAKLPIEFTPGRKSE